MKHAFLNGAAVGYLEISLAPGVCPKQGFISLEHAYVGAMLLRQGSWYELSELMSGVEPSLFDLDAHDHETAYRILVELVHQVPGARSALLATGDEPIEAELRGLAVYPRLVELLRTKLRMIDDGAFIVSTWANDHLATAVLAELDR